jgi:hypothetical protein
MLTLVTLALMAGAAGNTAASATAGAPPPEIERHYREYNLVTAFSTPHERYRIAEGTGASDPRLARVARLMERLEARVDEVDPGMVEHAGPKWRETVFRSDLVQVVSWRTNRSGDEGWATLDVSALGPASNVTLVGRFDELAGGDGVPPAETLLSIARPQVHTTEVHHWRRIDGVWRRDAATLHFLAN